MTALLQYWPGDDRGKEILDQMERDYEISPHRILFDGAREYYIVAAGPVSLRGWLFSIDARWPEHIEARTEEKP